MTILVVGGTGKTGRRVVAGLTDVRAVSRSSEPRFDWYDRDTWAPVLDGVSAVYLVPPADSLSDAEVKAFVPQAVAAGARRIVLLSARGIDPADGREAAVRESGVDWTVLRPTWFHQNFSEDMLLPQLLAGEITLPGKGNGAHPFIDAQDIADVAVVALTSEGHAGRVYELSGPEALSFQDAVDVIGRESGRIAKIVDSPPEPFTASLAGYGLSAEYAQVLTYSLLAIREGQDAHVSDVVPRVLGRPARSFGDYARSVVGAWA
ncbi:NAD(P)H-binding protein [Actinosynnema sp. NPDC020468]|uniref:NAD(P)H-binding protein n=1 Tax=Actinosynnema sp. NPDC020468 TaxID=3154488 RepID=UPI0033F48618